jgi:UDP-N-acetylglucosamine transferase subunit ALG13
VIFVTVGTQLPFDRMVRAIDRWAAESVQPSDVFAQIGPSSYQPQHIRYKPFVGAGEFDRLVIQASVIVSHAGMGSILTALTHGKPIVIMPRRLQLNEQRNDHQLATAERFQGQPGVFVAADELQLSCLLEQLSSLRGSVPLEPVAADALIIALRDFIDRS